MRFNKIFGIGLPRTGTTSLNIALNTIGISSIHFPFSLYETGDKSILNQYNAFIDTPIPMLYQKLDKACPNSGFVLTTRPIDDWLNSMEWLLSEGARIWGTTEARDIYKREFFGSEKFDSDLYKARFLNFHEEVNKYFKNREDLLVLDLDRGYSYKDICQFLEIPLYPGEYPRGNESRHATQLQRIAFKAGKYNSNIEKFFRSLDNYSKRIISRLSKYKE